MAVRNELFGGAAAAETVARAAEIVATVARRSPGWDGAAGALAQATSLAARARALGDEDEDAFAAALDGPSAETLDRSVELPLRIGRAAVDVCLLAADARAHGEGAYQADAVAASQLAAGAVRAVRHLVAVNLGVQPGDERLDEADALVRLADGAARTLDS